MANQLREEITKVAYELYEKSGRKKGDDLQNWLAAEKIVYFNYMIYPHGHETAFALLEYKPLDERKNVSRSPRVLKPRSARQGKSQKAERV